MALFKIFKGIKQNLPAVKTDGYAYFTTDDQKFYIDYGTEQRALVNPNPDWNALTGGAVIENKPFTVEQNQSDYDMLDITFI